MLQNAWEILQPYILAILGALGGGTIVYAIIRFAINRHLNKLLNYYDANKMADKVAKRLVGKTLNIDVTAIAEKRIKEIDEKLSDKMKAMENLISSYKRTLALMAAAMSKFKALTDEEKEALMGQAKELDKDYKPPEVAEVSTIKLEPIELPQQEAKESGYINLG